MVSSSTVEIFARPPDSVRVRLDVSYDGTDFAGWATQPNQRTVQELLESALGTVLRIPPPRVVVAGRTDAGVHAAAQVCHVDLPASAYEKVGATLARRLAGVLPSDVRVQAATIAPDGFDARFSACWRHYRYRISDSATGADPLRRHDTAAWRSRLDVEPMVAGASVLLGLHDFAAFCRRRDGASTIRELQRLEVSRSGELITVDVRADAFCHSMVRSLVGALAAVGARRQPLEWLPGLLERPIRADEIVVAPARGLSLIEVGYPAPGEFAARAAETRVLRTL
jgi:tRNA pseudouridine38-40 synthase